MTQPPGEPSAAGEPSSDRELPGAGAPPGGGSTGSGQAAATTAVRAGPGVAALAGLREPIVVILLLIAFFTSISGKPLDGLLMLVAGVSLAWDAGRRARRGTPLQAGRTRSRAGGGDRAGQGAPAAAARWRRPPAMLAWLAGGALYVFVVGSFSRYSWPATVAVVALGVAVVVTGWRGPGHPRQAPARPPAAGLALWGLALVAGCLWELSSLLQQPTLTTGSYAHPTISTLTDPALSTWAARSVFLAGWLGLGWFLVER